MALHIVNKPSQIAACLQRIAAKDTVLLIENGVYAAQIQSPLSSLLEHTRTNDIEIFVLDRDCAARGVQSAFNKVSTAQFVELTVQHPACVSWY